MKILALEHERSGIVPEQFQQFAKLEALKVWDLQQAGILRELYFRADCNEVVFVLECSSGAEAGEILAGLPFAQAGLITFEIIPLHAYSGFERLFWAS